MADSITPQGSAPPSPRLGPQKRHPLLARPLYAFQLPPTLLSSIQLRSIDVQNPLESVAQDQRTDPSHKSANRSSANSSSTLKCTICPSNPVFETSGHQRAHFRSEWHRYNLQITLKGGSDAVGLVDENGWEDLVTDLGDPTDEEADNLVSDTGNELARKSRSPDLVSLVLNKLNLRDARSAQSPDDSLDEQDDDVADGDGRHARHSVTAKSALLWFCTAQQNASQENKVHLEQTQLGIYRSLFPDPAEASAQPLRKASQTASDWYTAAVRLNQAQALRRVPAKGQSSGWKGKRLKGMDDAASMLGVDFLEGENYIPGLSTKLVRSADRASQADDEDASDSDGEFSSSSSSESESDQSTLSDPQINKHIDPPLRTWTIVLFGGGHFSIAVVALNPYIAPRQASKARPLVAQGSDDEILQEDRSLIVLAHKAFHRYTTRKKQGGSQSAQDASGKFAKSAGAQLRRYGEAALAEEVRALLSLSGYRKLIKDSERVYVRANGRAARGILWTWPGAAQADTPNASPLEGPRSDGRMRTIPFSTRNKATVGECLRVFAELSRVKVTRKTEEELQQEDEAYRKSLEGNQTARDELKRRRQREREEREAALRKMREKAQQQKEANSSLDKEEKKGRDRFEKMVDMVRRGRVEALTNHLAKYNHFSSTDTQESNTTSDVNGSFPTWWRAQERLQHPRKATTPLIPSTLLHLASEAGQAEIIHWLLTEKQADPTIGIPPPPSETSESAPTPSWPHRTAYDLIPSSSKNARNVFRKMYAQVPTLWNWNSFEVGGARIDSPLTEEMESNQTRRRAHMREKAKLREQERASAKKEEGQEDSTSIPAAPAPVVASHESRNRLGGPGQSTPKNLKDAKDKLEGVTPEMRMRIEREKRARAAEERFKKLQGGGGS
ncbi:unnamed protein product [Sympodiomycopsis kandeliae]